MEKYEYENLSIKVFSDICCESCSCKSENEHKKESVLKIDKKQGNTLSK